MKTKPITEIGYDSVSSFIDSLTHPESILKSSVISGTLGTLAYFFDTYMGISSMVVLMIMLLFIVEMFTGIKASKLEGKKISSKKFGSGIVKMGIYFVIITAVHNLSTDIEIKPFFGIEFNIYGWVHYFFLNFIIIQLIISNLENFQRLGWGDFMPFINKLSKWLKLNQKDEVKNEEE